MARRRLDAELVRRGLARSREHAVELIAQGRVAAGSINILARQPEHWSKGMVLCIVVEFYAILSLLASIMMLLNIG